MIIGLTGRMASGKTAVASIMMNKGWQEYTLAGPLKQMAKTLGFTYRELYGTQEDKMKANDIWGISAREFLQVFGTDICRDELPRRIPEMSGVWIRMMQEHCRVHHSQKIVISDVRFKDEAKAIKAMGGTIVQITRPGLHTDGVVHEHASETELDDIVPDIVIVNDGTLVDLENDVQNVIANSI